MAATPSWINVRHAGMCTCGAEVKPGDQARYDFDSQAYVACGRCDRSAPDVLVRVTVTNSDSSESSPLAGLEQFARCLFPSADVRRVVDAMIAAGTRAAFERSEQ
jgi:hypothetical protein